MFNMAGMQLPGIFRSRKDLSQVDLIEDDTENQ
jgi:hypothetical protein